MTPTSRPPLGVVIPTFQREEVLIDTLRHLFQQFRAIQNILLVDQTEHHEERTRDFLSAAVDDGRLRWLRGEPPSIPRAMNIGLTAGDTELVLFLDDDVIPNHTLVNSHINAHAQFPDAWAVVGQVLQPAEESRTRGDWESRGGFLADLDFPFWSNERAWVSNVMAGNLSVKRSLALDVGGFDENFEGAAYRFETEFARRLLRAGGKILFEPAASLRHLRATRGGTRSEGSHLTSASPRHGAGDYYFAMRSGWSLDSVLYMLKRPWREVCTRFHLQHPWYIPVKLVGELRAFMRACSLARQGPRLLAEEAGEAALGREPATLNRLPEEAAR
ncbi:MAG: glycosyltransferase family 2 protein [Planctomycetaceae bacterium]|nr:glycosyltransferase family 2 protein [Planctomycetaceae bacterium]